MRALWSWMLWATRDLLRRPAEAALSACGLTAFVFLVAAVLLLTQGLAETARLVLGRAPSLVVRRVEATGWVPMPSQQGLEMARGVPGVVEARARVWGVARGPIGPVTIHALDAEALREWHLTERALPAPGQAVVGPGVIQGGVGTALLLRGAGEVELEVVGVLESDSAVVAHDLVLVRETDARRILGLAHGQASDLAVEVFHDAEQAAILPELAAAFAWPVRITTRQQTVGQYSGTYARRGGLALLLLLPSLLLLALLVLVTVQARIGQRSEVGLLKALGWTTADVVRLHFWRGLGVALPAVAVGFALAYAAVFYPGVRWPAVLLLGWTDVPPTLALSPSGALLVLLEVGALVLVPWLVATLWAALSSASADPQDLLGEGA